MDERELIWAVYSAIQAMESSSNSHYHTLAQQWQAWLDYTKLTAAKVWYPAVHLQLLAKLFADILCWKRSCLCSHRSRKSIFSSQ